MKIIKSLKYHPDDDLEYIQWYDVADKSLAVKPQWLAKWLKNEAIVLARRTINRERVYQLPDEMPSFVVGICTWNALQHGQLASSGAFPRMMKGRVDLNGDEFVARPSPTGQEQHFSSGTNMVVQLTQELILTYPRRSLANHTVEPEPYPSLVTT